MAAALPLHRPALAAAFAALRAAAAGLAREYGPKGVHVGHVIIDGGVEGAIRRKRLPKDQDSAGENELLSPAAIAEAYWQLHLQQPSTCSFEIDLRLFNQLFLLLDINNAPDAHDGGTT